MNNTDSKFNYKAYLTPVIIVLFCLIPIILNIFIQNKNDNPIEKLLFTSIIPLIVIIVSVYQLRENLLSFILSDKSITFRRFLGCGKTKSFSFKELDGFNVQIKKTKGFEYEILKIVKDRKTVMNISQFYLENYFEVKQKIVEHLRLL